MEESIKLHQIKDTQKQKSFWIKYMRIYTGKK